VARLHVQAVGETRRNSVHLQCKNRPGTKFLIKKCTAVSIHYRSLGGFRTTFNASTFW
jgi:hypothetical protein